MDGPLDSGIRRRAMGCHWAGLAGLLSFVLLPIPFLGLLLPYLYWRRYRNLHGLIDDQGRQVVNFMLTWAIALLTSVIAYGVLWIVGWLLLLFLGGILVDLLSFGFVILQYLPLLVPGVLLVELGLLIRGALRTGQGQYYRYPWSLPFLG